MATTFHGGGSQSPTALSKPIEKIFEEAQHTGEILLCGRKLREYPKFAAKYDLVDTISADASKNRLSEIPKEICSYLSMEKLNCYHNVLKSIPDAIIQLQSLTYLNLSRNQLSIIPSFISQLQVLEVLIASHNRVVSLPEEIGVLERLMELDVSCNEIQHLPVQIGDLKSLKSLNVRRNLLQELPVEISKLNLRKLNISGNRISKIPTMFRRIETLEDIILHDNPLTMPPAHICTKGKQHIMKYLQIEANREDKKRLGILNEVEMKRFRKSLPPQQTVTSEEFRNMVDSPDKWKRHTVLSSDSGYSTTDSIEKIGWSPQETNSEPQHLIDSNNLALRAAAVAVAPDQRYLTARDPRRDVPPEPPQRVNSRLTPEKQTSLPPSTLPKPVYSSPPVPPTLYPSNVPTPLTPPTPQGPGPGQDNSPGILGTSLEDEFTRELQRQKQEYENKKKIAEQLRIQQEEEEEREQRRRAAQRIQDEQRALLDRQREEARQQEEQRAWEEARRKEAEELRRQEEIKMREEARRAEEQRQAEEARRREAEEARRREAEAQQREAEAKQHRTENKETTSLGSRIATLKKPTLSSSGSFKEERRPAGGSQPYRRTVSDSNQRLPLPSSTQHVVTNGPIEEQPSVNGSTPTNPSTDSSPNATPPHSLPISTNGPTTNDRPTTPQGSVQKRPKAGERVQTPTSKVAKPTDRSGKTSATSTSSRSGVPTAKKSSLNQDEEMRKSQQSLKGVGTAQGSRAGEQRLRTIQKEAANNYLNRRSSGSTSSEDDRKRSTPTRSLAYQGSSTTTSTAKTTAASKRSGTVMTNAQVRMLDDYTKDSNFTMKRQHNQQKENSDQLEVLRKTISTRLKRTLPENLGEALSDGVLLCHLANQIRPRSVASVHVPSPAVPKLTPPKCRKNVENFLEACRKIGVSKDQICEASDILVEKGISRVAITVAALVALSANSRHQSASKV